MEGWNIIKQAADWYFSNGHLWGLFLTALATSMFLKRKKDVFLAWYIVVYCIATLNPLSAVILSKLGLEDVYWRIFWMIPIGCVIANVYVRIVFNTNRKLMRNLLTGIAILSIVVCGKFIYTKDNFQLAENLYKIPDNVIEVSEYLEPGNAVLAPKDVMIWLRTYNADFYLPIGRQAYFFEENEEKNTLINSLSDPNVTDVGYIVDGALQYKCEYIVLANNRQMMGEWEAYGYHLVDQTDDYLIYKQE